VLTKLTAAGLVAAAASGALILASPAHAGIDTSGDGGILAGNQVLAPVSIPVILCGNAVAIVGHAGAGCRSGAPAGYWEHHHGYHHPFDS
jgi:hypothetical protein